MDPYLEAILEDGDARAVPVALPTVVDAVGGMTALVERTGVPVEMLYRTLSEQCRARRLLGHIRIIDARSPKAEHGWQLQLVV